MVCNSNGNGILMNQDLCRSNKRTASEKGKLQVWELIIVWRIVQRGRAVSIFLRLPYWQLISHFNVLCPSLLGHRLGNPKQPRFNANWAGILVVQRNRQRLSNDLERSFFPNCLSQSIVTILILYLLWILVVTRDHIRERRKPQKQRLLGHRTERSRKSGFSEATQLTKMKPTN